MAWVLIHISLIYYVLCFGKYNVIYNYIKYRPLNKCTRINILLQVRGILLKNQKNNQKLFLNEFLCCFSNPNKTDEAKWRSLSVFGLMLMQ